MKYAALVAISLLLSTMLAGCETAAGAYTRLIMETRQPPEQCVSQEDMAAAQEALTKRLSGMGLARARVIRQNSGCTGRLTVDLPPVKDLEQAVQVLTSTGQLEFVEIGAPDPKVQPGVLIRTNSRPHLPDTGSRAEMPDPYPSKTFKTILTGRDVAKATANFDSNGAPTIGLSLTSGGTKQFADYTSSHVGKVLAIVLDNEVLSAPMIQTAITDGEALITGRFTREQVHNLVAQIRSGALPVPLVVVYRGPVDDR